MTKYRFAKSSKLFPIVKIRIDDDTTVDEAQWLNALVPEFEQRRTQDSEVDLQLIDALNGKDDAHVDVSCEEVSSACNDAKRYYRIDNEGICVAALDHAPLFLALSQLLSAMISVDQVMSQVRLRGIIKGKVRGTISTNETRGLVPQPCLLELASRILSNKVHASLDA